MKSTIIALTIGLLVAAPGAALAQDHTIDGKAISAEQTVAVDEKCQDLLAHMGATGSAATPATDSSTGAVAVEDQADEAAVSDEAGTIDIDSLTVEQCQAGGFIAK